MRSLKSWKRRKEGGGYLCDEVMRFAVLWPLSRLPTWYRGLETVEDKL